eukprot:SAG11_NODE_4947_length_1712_cov_3.743335_2_plen_84_part_00
MSCFLQGLAGKRAQLAAEAAIDRAHGVQRYAGATEQERAHSFVAAARRGGVGGYLDDNTLKAELSALPKAHVAYHLACIQRNQ